MPDTTASVVFFALDADLQMVAMERCGPDNVSFDHLYCCLGNEFLIFEIFFSPEKRDSFSKEETETRAPLTVGWEPDFTAEFEPFPSHCAPFLGFEHGIPTGAFEKSPGNP